MKESAASRSEARPQVAIVGRPNTGKSSLFNRLVGERRAIVEPTAGVTRDRLALPVRVEDPDLDFDLLDTGGIGIVDRHDLEGDVEMQVQAALATSRVVIFLVDAREGRTPLDERIAAGLRRQGVPVILAANKAESREASLLIHEFSALGFGEALPLSALQGLGVGELLETLARHLPPAAEVPPLGEEALRLAILGRRNTGKSSYVNAVTGEQRVIVSPIPGTTRDAVEVRFRHGGQEFVLVDTAGVHRRGKVADAVEFFSLTRSDQALRRAHAALLFLDLGQPIARLDQELARTIRDRYKPVVLVGTKADLAGPGALRLLRDRAEAKLPHLAGAPACVISSTEKRGLARPLRLARELREEASRVVGTGELNRALEAAFAHLRFRGRGEKPKVFYGTQLKHSPPTFLLFVNRPQLFEKEVLRALSRDLQRRLGFERVPLRLVLRARKRSPSKRG